MKIFTKGHDVGGRAYDRGAPPWRRSPAQDIGHRHGNLRTAQQLVRQAYDYVSQAQFTNNNDMGGHAGRAKELLRQANDELKMAAKTANSNQR